jgi:hypothetical protein
MTWIGQDGIKLLSRPGPTKDCRASQEEDEDSNMSTVLLIWS